MFTNKLLPIFLLFVFGLKLNRNNLNICLGLLLDLGMRNNGNYRRLECCSDNIV